MSFFRLCIEYVTEPKEKEKEKKRKEENREKSKKKVSSSSEWNPTLVHFRAQVINKILHNV